MYADLANLTTLCGEEELIQLTDRADPPSGEVDQAVAEAALVAATSLIDGYVGAQYQLPLVSVPPMLVDIACDIARYRLYKTSATDQVRQRYKDAIDALTAISKGVITLPLPAAGGSASQPAGREDVMVIESEERIFSRSKLAGM